MDTATCTDCWNTAVEPVELTDTDGTTRIVCKSHTLSAEEFLDSLGF
jgi:hypothetical protein